MTDKQRAQLVEIALCPPEIYGALDCCNAVTDLSNPWPGWNTYGGASGRLQWFCTRDHGHDGPHIAHYRNRYEILKVWFDGKEAISKQG